MTRSPGPKCHEALGPNAILPWAQMGLGPGPKEIRTWDKMRISEVVEVRGEGDSVGYGCHGIAAILSIDTLMPISQ